jgi:ferrochelatase
LKTGVLIVNLGTPDSPATSDVRKYLREFLSDPRVIDISPAGRFMLVNFIIAPFRSPKSARLYKQIWREDGTSPLLYYSILQKELLQKALGDNFIVDMAMRYQSPSLDDVLEKFRVAKIEKLIVFPLFPQYSSAANGSVVERTMEIMKKWEVIPEVEFIGSFYQDKGFIEAFVKCGMKYDHKNFDHILFSFHGLPERQILKADQSNRCLTENCCSAITEKNMHCYRAQCHATARSIAGELNIPTDKYTVCFQSRLGRTPWIKPYSDFVIKERAEKGDKKLLIFAPAFVSDCLETIYEIGIEYDTLFRDHGGEKVVMVESLNDSARWIDAMRDIILQ